MHPRAVRPLTFSPLRFAALLALGSSIVTDAAPGSSAPAAAEIQTTEHAAEPASKPASTPASTPASPPSESAPTAAEPPASAEATSADTPPPPPAAEAPLVISTDRPGFSDSASIAPVGHFQLESGYLFVHRDRDSVQTNRNIAPELLGRVGVLPNRLELRASWSGWVWSDTESGGESVDSNGASDLSLGFKLKLIDQDGWIPRLALGFATTVGGGSAVAASQEVEPVVKLIWSSDLGKGCTLLGNLNLAFPTTEGERFTQGQASIYFSFPIVARITGFVEYFAIWPAVDGSDGAHSIDGGFSWLLNDRVQFDARVGFGLNNEADNVFAGVGLSVLF